MKKYALPAERPAIDVAHEGRAIASRRLQKKQQDKNKNNRRNNNDFSRSPKGQEFRRFHRLEENKKAAHCRNTRAIDG